MSNPLKVNLSMLSLSKFEDETLLESKVIQNRMKYIMKRWKQVFLAKSMSTYHLVQRVLEKWKDKVSYRRKRFKLLGNIRRIGVKKYLRNKKNLRIEAANQRIDSGQVLLLRDGGVWISPTRKAMDSKGNYGYKDHHDDHNDQDNNSESSYWQRRQKHHQDNSMIKTNQDGRRTLFDERKPFLTVLTKNPQIELHSISQRASKTPTPRTRQAQQLFPNTISNTHISNNTTIATTTNHNPVEVKSIPTRSDSNGWSKANINTPNRSYYGSRRPYVTSQQRRKQQTQVHIKDIFISQLDGIASTNGNAASTPKAFSSKGSPLSNTTANQNSRNISSGNSGSPTVLQRKSPTDSRAIINAIAASYLNISSNSSGTITNTKNPTRTSPTSYKSSSRNISPRSPTGISAMRSGGLLSSPTINNPTSTTHVGISSVSTGIGGGYTPKQGSKQGYFFPPSPTNGSLRKIIEFTSDESARKDSPKSSLLTKSSPKSSSKHSPKNIINVNKISSSNSTSLSKDPISNPPSPPPFSPSTEIIMSSEQQDQNLEGFINLTSSLSPTPPPPPPPPSSIMPSVSERRSSIRRASILRSSVRTSIRLESIPQLISEQNSKLSTESTIRYRPELYYLRKWFNNTIEKSEKSYQESEYDQIGIRVYHSKQILKYFQVWKYKTRSLFYSIRNQNMLRIFWNRFRRAIDRYKQHRILRSLLKPKIDKAKNSTTKNSLVSKSLVRGDLSSDVIENQYKNYHRKKLFNIWKYMIRNRLEEHVQIQQVSRYYRYKLYRKAWHLYRLYMSNIVPYKNSSIKSSKQSSKQPTSIVIQVKRRLFIIWYRISLHKKQRRLQLEYTQTYHMHILCHRLFKSFRHIKLRHYIQYLHSKHSLQTVKAHSIAFLSNKKLPYLFTVWKRYAMIVQIQHKLLRRSKRYCNRLLLLKGWKEFMRELLIRKGIKRKQRQRFQKRVLDAIDNHSIRSSSSRPSPRVALSMTTNLTKGYGLGNIRSIDRDTTLSTATKPTPKDAILKDAMLKDAMLKDAMLKDAMLKDAMLKDAMLKDAMLKQSITEQTAQTKYTNPYNHSSVEPKLMNRIDRCDENSISHIDSHSHSSRPIDDMEDETTRIRYLRRSLNRWQRYHSKKVITLENRIVAESHVRALYLRRGLRRFIQITITAMIQTTSRLQVTMDTSIAES